MTNPHQGPRGAAPAAPGRVEEGLFLPVNGLDQWVTIRGEDRTSPVLMMLHGPGFGFSPMAPLYAPLERDFVLVQWDQPGSGATWAKNGARRTGRISHERLARDGVAVAEAVLARLGAQRMILLGVSGGSIVGLLMAKARPDLFAAFVGNGQVVDWARQEALSYEMILRRAREADDKAAAAEIEALGPPPWDSVAKVAVKSKYANVMTAREQAYIAGLDPAVLAAWRAPRADASWIAHALPPFDPMAQSLAVFTALWPQIAAFDARALGRPQVPMIFLQGTEDAHLVSSEVEAYAAEIGARYAPIEGAGHMSSFLADELAALLARELA